MDKVKVIELLIELQSVELANLSEIAEKARSAATSGELKQEGKYDTRAIEEGYLAGAQAKRVAELRSDVDWLSKLLNSTQTSEKVISGSLVTIENDKKRFNYLLTPGSGGQKVDYANEIVTTLSLNSNIAAEMVGLEADDDFEVETPRGLQEFIILEIK